MIDVIYGRVSTEEQTSNTSLGDQEVKCRDYLERIGLTNIVVYKEDYSGFERNRPELNKVLDLMKQGKVRSFTSLRVDRICRKVSILETLREQYFKPLNIEVHTLDLMSWQWTAAHESLQDNLCLMGSFWGKILVEVMQNGRKKHVINGNVITAGHAPLGLTEVVEYDARGKRTGSHVEFDEFESGIVLRIFTHFVNEDSSIARIANKLNEEEIPTYTEIRQFNSFKRYQDRISQTGHKWRSSTVRQILRETAYIGKWYFGKTRTETSYSDNGDKIKKKVRTDKNLIQVEIPALVPLDMWQAAQKKLDKNREEKRGRKPMRDYLLSKRIRCQCGAAMGASARNGGHYLYYRCPIGVEKDTVCQIKYIRADLVDNIAWGWFYRLLSNRQLLKAKIEDYITEKRKLIEPLQVRMEFLDSSLNKKHAEHNALIANVLRLPELAQAKVLAGIEQVEEVIKEYGEEKKDLLKEMAKHEDAWKTLMDYWELIKEDEDRFNQNRIVILGDEDDSHNIFELEDEVVIEEKSYPKGLFLKDEPKTYDEKLKYIQDFDLRAEIINDGQDIRLTCKVGSDVLSLLNITQPYNEQKQQRFFISFSDILKLDFTTLAQFEQMEMTK